MMNKEKVFAVFTVIFLFFGYTTPAFAVPAKPTSVVVTSDLSVPSRAALITWTKPSATPLGYHVRIYKEGVTDYSNFERDVVIESGTTESVVLENLLANQRYFAKVYATYDNTSLASDDSEVITVTGIPDALAQQPDVIRYSAGTVTISWATPGSDGGLPITQFVVKCNPKCGSLETYTTLDTELTITGLETSSSYKFSVLAENLRGASQFYSPESIAVIPYADAIAPNLTSVTGKDASVEVAWEKLEVSGQSVEGYEIQALESGSLSTVGSPVTVGAEATSAVVSSLINGVSYRFRLRAIIGSQDTPVAVSEIAIPVASAPQQSGGGASASTSPSKAVQSSPAKIPATLKKGKKFNIPAKNALSLGVSVQVSGACKKTTVVKTLTTKVRVGKKIKKVKTKIIVGYTVTATKKKSSCSVTQSVPGNDTYAPFSSTSVIKTL